MRICAVVMILIQCILLSSLQAQGVSSTTPMEIKPFIVGISTHKTTNLIFPYGIKSVDRGSSAILAQKAKGVDNILQVKADTAGFSETNLSVVTNDAKFYSFLLFYTDKPACLNFLFQKDLPHQPTVILDHKEIDQAAYQRAVECVSQQKPFLKNSVRAHRLQARLSGIYLLDSMLVFSIDVKNSSQFTYHPESIRFMVKNNTKTKRTIIQQLQVKPLMEPAFTGIKGVETFPIIIGFKPFTFSDSQRLSIEIEEANGGRTIKLPIKLKTLLRAKQINDM